MANENMIKFLRGNVANLPQTATSGALYFTKDEGIYQYSDNAPTSSLDWDSVTLTVKNLKIKNPVFVEPITGKVFNLNLYHYSPNSPDTKYTNLPIWDSPVMLMDKSALKMVDPDADRKALEKDFNTEMQY